MSTLPQVTERDLWATPQAVVDAVAGVMMTTMGVVPYIDLACSPDNAKAHYRITESVHDWRVPSDWELDAMTSEDEGLFGFCPMTAARLMRIHHWAWLNPPYSRGNLPRFTAWAAAFAQYGGTVALCVPASHSDSWWRENVTPHARMILQPDRRIQFEPPPGVEPSSNSGQNAIVIMAPRRPWDGDTIVRRLEF